MVISRTEPFWYSLNSFSILKFGKRPPPDQETTLQSKKFCEAKMLFQDFSNQRRGKVFAKIFKCCRNREHWRGRKLQICKQIYSAKKFEGVEQFLSSGHHHAFIYKHSYYVRGKGLTCQQGFYQFFFRPKADQFIGQATWNIRRNIIV